MISTQNVPAAEVPEELLRPFVAAAQLAFEQMAGLSLAVRGSYRLPDFRTSGNVSAVIGLAGPGQGALVLSLGEDVAQAAARRVLAEVDDNPDRELVDDCVGELANIIAGQARGMLADSPYEFAFGTPRLVSGVGHEIARDPGAPCLVLDFTSDVGDVQMQVSCWPSALIPS